MSGAGEREVAGSGIKNGIHKGDKFPRGKVFHQQLLSLVKTSAGVQHASARERSIPRVADMSSAAAVPFPETSASTKSPTAIGKWDEVVPISTDGAGRNAETGNGKARHVRRGLGQKSLLNGASFLSFETHGFALGTFRLEAARVMDRDRHVIAQGLKKPELLAGKSVEIGVRSGKHSYQALADVQGNRHFRMS